MKSRRARISILLSVGILFSLFAASPELVAAEKKPKIVGWRGNWTGKFPDANPPIKWGKVSKVMAGLRCQAEKPEDDKPSGVPAYHGSLTQWLVLGPLPSVGGDEAIDEEFIGDEANWQPAEGEKVNGVAWKKVEPAGSIVDFATMFAKEMPDKGSVGWLLAPYLKKPYAAYCHTWFYSPTEGAVKFPFRTCRKAKLYINGTLVNPDKKKRYRHGFLVTLKKGWNRVLCKAVNLVMPEKVIRWKTKCPPHPSSWFIDLGLRAAWPYETETENIAWATRMPDWSTAGPVIVGDKVFALSEQGDLICVNKKDGKIRWLRSTTFFDVAAEKEKEENPAFQEVAALVKQLEEFNADFVKPESLTKKKLVEREKLYKKITGAMQKIDKDKYHGSSQHGYCVPTPVSDGKHIYVWLGNGIAACFDLDGNRKWTASGSRARGPEHGYSSSPILLDNKLIVFNGHLIAFDAVTGETAWTNKEITKVTRKGYVSTHNSLIGFKIENKDFIYFYGLILRVSDGKVVGDNGGWQGGWQGWIATAIIENGSIYQFHRDGRLCKSKLPRSLDNVSFVNEGKVRIMKKCDGHHVRGILAASPLHHNGLLYAVDVTGILYVVDDKAQELVYRQDLGMGKEMGSRVYGGIGSVYANPVLAGKHIYVFGRSGTTVVFKPGRTYQEVARNKMEGLTWPGHWREKTEGFTGTPVADGNRLYLRGDKYLYCIGKKSGGQR